MIDVDTRLARDGERGSLIVQALMLGSDMAIGPGTLSGEDSVPVQPPRIIEDGA